MASAGRTEIKIKKFNQNKTPYRFIIICSPKLKIARFRHLESRHPKNGSAYFHPAFATEYGIPSHDIASEGWGPRFRRHHIFAIRSSREEFERRSGLSSENIRRP